MNEERGHDKWILDDIRAIGGDADAVERGKPHIPCQVMVGYAYYAIEWISPYSFLGMVHVLEGVSVMLADQVASAVKLSLGTGGEAGLPTSFRMAPSMWSTPPYLESLSTASRIARRRISLSNPRGSRTASMAGFSKTWVTVSGVWLMRLDGKKALITGAGSGIGRALAIEAAHRGVCLALTGRRADALEETASLLSRDGHAVLSADVTNPVDRRAVMADIRSTLGAAWICS